jgi:hypothetical protein
LASGRQISKRWNQAGRRAPRRFALTSALARVTSASMTGCGTAFVRTLILRSKRSKSSRHCDSGYKLIKTRDFSFRRIGRSGLRTPFSNTARKLSGIGWLLCKARTGAILAKHPSPGQAGSGRFFSRSDQRENDRNDWHPRSEDETTMNLRTASFTISLALALLAAPLAAEAQPPEKDRWRH